MSMATEYRDIATVAMKNQNGTISNSSTLAVATETPPSQVFKATHDGKGIRLSHRERSFISFSFGGRWIEDFDLIATINGDSLSRTLSGDFEDLTSSYDVLDGQFYHSTHFKSYTISFTLSTDGIDQKKLEDFRNWFAGGKMRELILSEHPNRAIIARVSQPPELEMLPFEKEITINIGGADYTTSTTNYKGSINIGFIADEPFWYSLINIFGSVDSNGTYVTQWNGENFLGQTDAAKNAFKDVLKISYEDGIPIYTMIGDPMLFGEDIYAVASGRIIGMIAGPATSSAFSGKTWTEGAEGCFKVNNTNWMGARIENTSTSQLEGVIDGAYIANSENVNISIGVGQYQYLYYAGTAPAPVQLRFTIPIQLDLQSSNNANGGYIKSIANKRIPRIQNNKELYYNSIIIEGEKIREMKLILPNFLASYNDVMFLFKHMTVGTGWETIRSLVRDEIRHPVIRKYAVLLANHFSQVNTTVTDAQKTAAINYFKQFLNPTINDETVTTNFTVELDSKTGSASGTFEYYDLQFNSSNHNPVTITASMKKTLKENVGDMVNSNYLLLDEKNYFSSDFQIKRWASNTKTNSYRIYHTFNCILSNFSIKYRNMYY